ncbi:MAG: PTS fructose transporter subunit IIA [Burkholderiales bacterium]
MVGILIIAHGALGESLIQCASHVMGGRPPQLLHMGISIHDDPQSLLPEANRLIQSLDQGQGVLVFSDVYGATPCNLACKLLDAGRVEGIAGVNLPMLVRALTYRNEALKTVLAKAVSGGIEGVVKMPSPLDKYATSRN